MPIQFTCPSCLADLQLKDECAGACLNCPHCQAPMVLPDLELESDDGVSAGPVTPSPAMEEDCLTHVTPTSRLAPGSARGVAGPGGEASDRVKFFCTGCGTKMSARASGGGRMVTCPTCGGRIPVPSLPGRGEDAVAEQASSRGKELAARPKPDRRVGNADPAAHGASQDTVADRFDSESLPDYAMKPVRPLSRSVTVQPPRRTHSGMDWRSLSPRAYYVAGGGLAAALLLAGLVVALALVFDRGGRGANEEVPPPIESTDLNGSVQTATQVAEAPAAAAGQARPSAAVVPFSGDRPTPRRRVGVNSPPPPASIPPETRPASSAPLDEPPSVFPPEEEQSVAPNDSDAVTRSKLDEPMPSAATESDRPTDAAPRDSDDVRATTPTEPIAKKRTQDLLGAIDRTIESQESLLGISGEIVDVKSARRLAAQWAIHSIRLQALIDRQHDLAGQELIGTEAARYDEAKALYDRQSRDIEAELARLEEVPGVMPILDGEREKRTAAGTVPDASPASAPRAKGNNPTGRQPPRPLKRVTGK